MRRQWFTLLLLTTAICLFPLLARFSPKGQKVPIWIHISIGIGLWLFFFGTLLLASWWQSHEISIREDGLYVRRGGLGAFFPWRVFERCTISSTNIRGSNYPLIRLSRRRGEFTSVQFSTETPAPMKLAAAVGSNSYVGLPSENDLDFLVTHLKRNDIQVEYARTLI